MKGLYLLIMIFIGFTLTSCAIMGAHDTPPATEKVTPVPPPKTAATKSAAKPALPQAYLINKKPKNPLAVQVYSNGTRLTHPYTILAKESVSKYNANGIKRQEANIHDALRRLAASIGGDAVINVTHDRKHVYGTIVSFERNRVG